MKIKQALNEAKLGNTQSVYYLKGADYFLQNFFIEKISQIFFDKESTSKRLLHPDDMSAKEIVEQLMIKDLFMMKQVFIIVEPQRITGKAQKDFIELCFSPIENHLLFLINDNYYSSSTFFSKIESRFDFIDVQSPFTKEMKQWANYLIKKRGKQANYKVIDMIVDMAGDSVAHLDNEIEKLSIQIEDRENILITDLEKSSGWKKDRKLWEFLKAFSEKNYDESILLGKSLLLDNQNMISMMYPLVALLQELLFIKMKNGTFQSYGGYIPLPPSIKKRLKYFANSFAIEDIKSGLILLNDIDKRIKSQNTNDETELIQFINNVIG